MPILKKIFLFKWSSIQKEKMKQKTVFPTFLTPGHDPPVIWPVLGLTKGELRAARKKWIELNCCRSYLLGQVREKKRRQIDTKTRKFTVFIEKPFLRRSFTLFVSTYLYIRSNVETGWVSTEEWENSWETGGATGRCPQKRIQDSMPNDSTSK